MKFVPMLALGAALSGSILADQLTLRNGDSITGTWLGVDRDAVTFLVNGKSVRYARADVAKVAFSSDATAPSPGAKMPAPPPPPPPAPVASPQPDTHPLNVVHFWNPAGPITPLEAEPIVRVAGAGWEIKGPHSPYRVQRAPGMLFLVWLADNADARKIKLVRLVSGSARRPYSLTGADMPLSLTPAGGSVGLAPVGELAAGEYAFVMAGGTQAYCFAVE